LEQQGGQLHLGHGPVEEAGPYVLGHLMLLMRDEFVVSGRAQVLSEKEQNGHHVV